MAGAVGGKSAGGAEEDGCGCGEVVANFGNEVGEAAGWAGVDGFAVGIHSGTLR